MCFVIVILWFIFKCRTIVSRRGGFTNGCHCCINIIKFITLTTPPPNKLPLQEMFQTATHIGQCDANHAVFEKVDQLAKSPHLVLQFVDWWDRNFERFHINKVRALPVLCAPEGALQDDTIHIKCHNEDMALEEGEV